MDQREVGTNRLLPGTDRPPHEGLAADRHDEVTPAVEPATGEKETNKADSTSSMYHLAGHDGAPRVRP